MLHVAIVFPLRTNLPLDNKYTSAMVVFSLRPAKLQLFVRMKGDFCLPFELQLSIHFVYEFNGKLIEINVRVIFIGRLPNVYCVGEIGPAPTTDLNHLHY